MLLKLEDLLIKPFNITDVLSVLDKSVDRLISKSLFELRFENGYSFDFQKWQFYLNDEVVNLGKKEQELFNLLFANRNKVVSYSTIENIVWNSSGDKRGSLKILINKLRKKVGKERIVVEYDMGYKLVI
jgi:DNA-binding response OmpR family regulator